MQEAFIPGTVDYEGAMAHGFNEGRQLSPDALTVWREAFSPYFSHADRVIDVGSGTGRFAVLMAEWFGSVVVGIEPAHGMRHEAASAKHSRVRYVGGRAEQIPIMANWCTVALLSNVYHHFTDPCGCAAELHRVAAPHGWVLLRGAFAGRLDAIGLFEFFPEAKAVCEQFPRLENTVDVFSRQGFAFETVRRVTQRTCSSLKELANRTRLRADTTLMLMSDQAYSVRQTALEQAAANEVEPKPVYDTLDFLVLRNSA